MKPCRFKNILFLQIATASALILLLFIGYISWNKAMDPDEMESLAAASNIYDGSVIYRDFWQMHTPVFYYFLTPLFLFFTTMKVFYAGRAVMFLLLLMNGYLLFIISERLFTKTTGALSFLLYLTCLPVIGKMIEIRPDGLVVIFSNLSIVFLLQASLSPGISFFLAGVCGALAFLSKQSGIFFVLGAGIFFIINTLMQNRMSDDKDIFSRKRFNLKSYLFFGLGFLLPLGIFIFLLLVQGAYQPFIQHAINNDFLRAGLMLKTEYKRFLANRILLEMFYTNLMIFFLAAMFLMRIGKGSGRFVKARGFIFILLMVSLAGLYLTLHAWLQDFLLFSQYLVLLAAPMLVVFFEFISELFQKSRKILSLFLLVSMLGCLCLPPLVNEYSSKWNNFNLNRRLKCFDQVILSTKKSDKCLSVEFPCPFRLAGYFYRMCWPGLESRSIINHDEEALIDEILHQNVVVIVPSQVYFFMPQLLYLIHKNYVLGDYSFYTPGQIWGPSQVEKVEQDVLVSGYYQIAGWEGVSIDGRSLKQGTIYLSKGMHIFDLPDRQKMYGFFYDVKLNLAPSG